VTEFGAQGLELDAALLAWGTDFVRANGSWSNANARGYKRGAKVKDPFQLRLNACRVLLTRGRDATVVFVPPIDGLNETYGVSGGGGDDGAQIGRAVRRGGILTVRGSDGFFVEFPEISSFRWQRNSTIS